MARSVPSDVTNTVFGKNFYHAFFNVTTLPGKTGHFFRAVEGDADYILPFKFTKRRLTFIVARKKLVYGFDMSQFCSFEARFRALSLNILRDLLLLQCDCCTVVNLPGGTGN